MGGLEIQPKRTYGFYILFGFARLSRTNVWICKIGGAELILDGFARVLGGGGNVGFARLSETDKHVPGQPDQPHRAQG